MPSPHVSIGVSATEAEDILARLEANRPSFRIAFCLGMVGLATLVVAYVHQSIPDVIRTKSLGVINKDNSVAGVIGIVNEKVAFGTDKNGVQLLSIGQGTNGQGVIVLGASTDKSVVRLGTVNNGGGSVSVDGPDGNELANASPNVTSSGSLFINNALGKLIGEFNGDTTNGGVIAVHDANGKETARVTQP